MKEFESLIKKFNPLSAVNHEFTAIYLRQIGTTTVIKGLSIIISIIYVPLVLNFLNQEKYGIWVTLTTVITWLRLLDVGLGNGMRNKLAEAIALKNIEKGRVYVSTTYGLLGGIFLFVLIVFYLINPYINWQIILNTHNIARDELLRITNVSVTFIVLSFIFQPITLIYTAHGNSAIGGFVQLQISFISLLLILLASKYAQKGDLLILAWIVTGVPVAVYIIFSLYTFLFKYKQFRPSLSSIRLKESNNLLRLSIQFFIVQITATILYSSIPFVVTQLFSPNEVTQFNIANSIYNLPIILMSLITAPGHPLITQAFAKQDFPWMKNILNKQIIISYLLSSLTILLILCSPLIFKIWVGKKVSIPFSLSVCIGIYSIIQVLTAPYSTFINAIGKIKILVLLGPIGIILFLVFSILISQMINNVVSIALALTFISLIGLILIPYKLKQTLSF